MMLSDSDLCGELSNPRLLIATSPLSIPNGDGNSSVAEIGLAISVLDITTGEVLHEFRHSKAQGPVHVVEDKNWFAYSFFDSQAFRYKYSVVEIIEAACEDHQNASFVMNGRASNPSEKGSRVLRSEGAVHFPCIKALDITKGSRERAKCLLFGAPNGQIMLSHVNEANDTKREGAIWKWMSSFVDILSPQLNLTRAGPVEGLRKIVSLPLKIMPGSLVFAYGIDLLLVHVVECNKTASHSKGYDSYVILATLGAIFVALLMTRILPKYKKSKKRDVAQ